MKQEQFLARYQHEWQQLDDWLKQRRSNTAERMNDAAFPARYRRLCQHLALARKRGYSPHLVQRLQHLMQRGHALLYRTRTPRLRRALEFLLADFPALVRSQGRMMWIACALFCVPLIGSFVLLQYRPDMIHMLLDPEKIWQVEGMYNPSSSMQRLGRDSGGDWYMFGYYILNNISIGLRCFASGLFAGYGSALVLLYNGFSMGSVAGHLQQSGFGDPFWRFVVGHASFELTAIVLSGGAGLQLGLRLLMPGRKRRIQALAEGGQIGAQLCLGIAFMLLVAAFIEAFWSSMVWVPMWGKLSVAALLWSVVIIWLWRGGRGNTQNSAASSLANSPSSRAQATTHAA